DRGPTARGRPAFAGRGWNLCRPLNHPGSRYVTPSGARRRDGARFPEPKANGRRVPMTQIRLMAPRAVRRGLWSAGAIVTAGTLAATALGAAPAGAHTTAYRQVNLVSDQPGHAALTDPDLVNAWG